MEFQGHTGYLRFDNLNFKLAILQELVYRRRLFQFDYDTETILQNQDTYVSWVSWVKDVCDKIQEIEIPSHLAAYVAELRITPEDEIYRLIMPGWEQESRFFDIQKISPEEIKQFTKLTRIEIWRMSADGKRLAKELKPFGVQVKVVKARKANFRYGRHAVSPIGALLLLLTLCCGMGAGVAYYIAEYKPAMVKVSDEELEQEDDFDMPEETKEPEDITQELQITEEEIAGVILETNTITSEARLKDKEGRPYTEEWFTSIMPTKGKYFLVCSDAACGR